ncbi:MAG: hypothetical protein JWM59_4093 [Verrucomicrobiales bacterium]|nr:hypothetical protein [Verrucomicrobiales bacterium]
MSLRGGHDRDSGYGYDRDGGHRGYSRSRHDDRHDCERPVRMVKVCVGHNRHGCVVYRWVPAPVHHRGGGYSRGEHSRGYGHYDRPSSRSRSGITIRIGG